MHLLGDSSELIRFGATLPHFGPTGHKTNENVSKLWFLTISWCVHLLGKCSEFIRF